VNAVISTAPPADSTVRAMTDDGAFRVIVARSTNTVRGICEAQGLSGTTAVTMGDLLTATILFRETMAPGFRVQGILRTADQTATLVADSAPEGKTRGLVQSRREGAQKSSILAEEGAILQMMRTLKNGSVNQGVVRVPEQGGITRSMMAYMQESEQVDTMLAVATTLSEDGQVLEAGGYMVQLLPEVGRGPLAIMAQRLEDFVTIDHMLTAEFTPEYLRDELLYGMPFTALDRSDLSFDCWCSEDRLLGALATLDKAEIQSMIDDGKPLEITCDYCHKDYAIRPARLQGLVGEN
jgi:molecular chaperone Hsp33